MTSGDDETFCFDSASCACDDGCDDVQPDEDMNDEVFQYVAEDDGQHVQVEHNEPLRSWYG